MNIHFNLRIPLPILGIALVALIILLSVRKCNSDSDTYEIQHDSLRLELISEVDSLIKINAPSSGLNADELVDASINYNIDLIFMLAQAKLESNFGTSGMAAKSNSVWNIYAYDSSSYSEVLKYDNPNESIHTYAKILKLDYLSDSVKEVDLLNSFVNKDGLRYASNELYEDTLSRIYYRYLNSRIGQSYANYKMNQFPE
jgi:beta-N-acetylglucosaminidase